MNQEKGIGNIILKYRGDIEELSCGNLRSLLWHKPVKNWSKD